MNKEKEVALQIQEEREYKRFYVDNFQLLVVHKSKEYGNIEE